MALAEPKSSPARYCASNGTQLEMIMKTIVIATALMTSILNGAVTAQAFDGQSFWEEQVSSSSESVT
jgi:hypothetical protein